MSNEATNSVLAFHFPQLAADGTSNVTVGGFPTIRWAQTANFGFVPNSRMKNVFMAVAIDLGDPTSPYGSVHIRDKQDVGARLVLAGRAIAYGDSTVYYSGPIAVGAKVRCVAISSSEMCLIFTKCNITIKIPQLQGFIPLGSKYIVFKSMFSTLYSYSNVSSLIQVSVSYGYAQNGLELRYPYGFELGCVTSTGTTDWFEGTAVKVDTNNVIVEIPGCPNGQKAVWIRYCWRTDPCTFKKCPVYSSDFPSPPFIMELE